MKVKLFVTVMAAFLGITTAAAAGGASTSIPDGAKVVYSKTVVAQPAPAANFSVSGSGDGWAIGFTTTEVFNIFHHSDNLSVNCHLQTTAAPCAASNGYDSNGVKVVTDNGANFLTAAMPSIWSDVVAKKIYVFATLASAAGGVAANTAGVVCIDAASTASNPFCGFVALSRQGDATPMNRDNPQHPSSQVTNAVVVGSRWYSFNYSEGSPSGTKDQMMCFDLASKSACPGQPYAVNYGSISSVAWAAYPIAPGPGITAVGSEIVVPVASSTTSGNYACFSALTTTSCGGSFPFAAPAGVEFGATAIPTLSGSGSPNGFCLPGSVSDACFGLSGASVATPSGFDQAIPGSLGKGYLAPAVELGSRIYVPLVDYSASGVSSVGCYDFSANAACSQFPHALPNASYVYTVNVDPEFPACLWTGADGGSGEIQNFDAYSAGHCGAGGVKFPTANIVQSGAACHPTAWQMVTVKSPDRSTYTSGTVQPETSTGSSVAGFSALSIGPRGSVALPGATLASSNSFTQFAVNLVNAPAVPVVITVQWTGAYHSSCAMGGVSAKYTDSTKPVTPGTLPATGFNSGLIVAFAGLLGLVGLASILLSRSYRRGRELD